MDCALGSTAEDPWVRISDCIKSLFSPIMSDSHGHVPLQPPVSLGEEEGTQGHPNGNPSKLDAASDAPKTYTSTDGSIVKKGPPVAPKPAWFRQSLKGLRHRGPDPRPLPAASCPQPTPVLRERLGPHLRASSSIRQRISSFETFGSSQLPDRGAHRASPQPPSSSGEAVKPPGKQEGGHIPGLLGRGAPRTAEQPAPGSPPAMEPSDPGVSGTPPPERMPSPKALSPDPLLSLLSAQTTPSQGAVVKAPSQRARSFPLTRTLSREVQPLEEKTCQLYSISSRVSSAVMKSLLCLPSSLSGGQTPRSPKEGASPVSSEAPAANSCAGAAASDRGFSIKCVSAPPLPPHSWASLLVAWRGARVQRVLCLLFFMCV